MILIKNELFKEIGSKLTEKSPKIMRFWTWQVRYIQKSPKWLLGRPAGQVEWVLPGRRAGRQVCPMWKRLPGQPAVTYQADARDFCLFVLDS